MLEENTLSEEYVDKRFVDGSFAKLSSRFKPASTRIGAGVALELLDSMGQSFAVEKSSPITMPRFIPAQLERSNLIPHAQP